MLITELAVAAIIIVMGIINLKGNISTLHSYHRARVKAEDVKPFGRLMGIGTIIIGVDIIINSIANYIGGKIIVLIGTAILFLAIAIGIVICFYALKKYNKGIF